MWERRSGSFALSALAFPPPRRRSRVSWLRSRRSCIVTVPDPEVPGRLAGPWILVSEPSSGEGLPSLALSGARCPGQSGEEFPDSISDLGLPGDAASDASFEGFSDPQTCLETQLSAHGIQLLSAAASASVVSASGGNVFSVFHRVRGPSSKVLPSAPAEFRRSSPGGFGQHDLGFLLPRGSSVVVRRLPSSRRSSTRSLAARAVAVHQRFGFGLGYLPWRRPHFRFVVSSLFGHFDQPQGAPCGTVRGSGVSSSSASSISQLVCGQHHCSGLSAESGRHSFFSPQFRGSGDPVSLRVPPDSLSPSVHPGSSERHGRLPQLPFAGPQLGLDPVFSNFPGSPFSVACDDRLACNVSQPSPSGLLLANGRSSVGSHGCDDAAVGWSSGLCLPSLWLSPERHREGPAIS